jgi:cation diffusion facilitator family transporter
MTDAHPESGQSGHEPPPTDHDHDHDHGEGDVRDEGSRRGHGPAGHHDHRPATGINGFVLSLFRPHSHDAADSVDSALEASTEGIRAVKISLVALGATAIAQLIVVLITGSVALLADTIHNFSDALTAIPLWIAFVLSRRAANRRYTYGYGRAEDLAGVFIVVMIALSSMLAAYESIRRLLDPQPITHAWVVVAAGLIGFAGNELVAVYRIRVGTKIGSAALVADGLHARTDGFTSLAVVLGAIGVMAGFPLADPIVGLLITVAILAVLRGAARDIYRRLMDAVDPDLVDAAEAAVRDVPGVRSVDSVQLRWIGHRMRAEITLTVDDTLTVVKAHAIADEAHHRLIHRVPRLDDATVHVNPSTRPGVDHHTATGHHQAQPPAATQ